MPTLIATLMFVIIGFALSFEIARRTNGLLCGILAYAAGFLGVFLAVVITMLFEAPFERLETFASLVAFFVPAFGIFFGKFTLPSRKRAK